MLGPSGKNEIYKLPVVLEIRFSSDQTSFGCPKVQDLDEPSDHIRSIDISHLKGSWSLLDIVGRFYSHI